MKKNQLSIIVPTYTGVDTIAATFESILKQKNVLHSNNTEIITVIDGPNKELLELVESYKSRFTEVSIKFKVFQFSKNKGRFAARLYGAKKAFYSQLLFVDDRVVLDENFFNGLKNEKEKIVIPRVIMNNSPTIVSDFLKIVRNTIYKNEGKVFDINIRNFDVSGKGTTCLLVDKDIFLEASLIMEASYTEDELKNSSDDTKLLKKLISINKTIRKTNLKIFYNPRSGIVDEIKHTYARGPKFIDYYFNTKTKYFKYIISYIVTLPAGLFLLVLRPYYFMILTLMSTILYAIFIYIKSKNTAPFFRSFCGGLVVIVAFGSGVLKGLLIKIK